MFYRVQKQDAYSKARTGLIQTDHGSIQTPIFMPVGTQAAVKAIHFHELEHDIKAEIILGNTYHLYLRPGLEVLQQAGGLHRFNTWQKPMLTDSGGFQVYSLAHRRKITDEGVKFASHIDGSYHIFTPERVMEIQRIIGADIVMAFDECTPYPCEYDYAKKSLKLTHRWLDACIKSMQENQSLYGYRQFLFPIVQGSVYKDLRIESAKYIADKGSEGNAIGGLAVGEPDELMYEMCGLVCDILPADKPRYLMGVGTPANILESISLGVDMFDCVMPTRNARHGYLFTNQGIINIKNKKWEFDFSPIDENSSVPVIRTHSKAYLRHLIRTDEILGMQLATLNNLGFYLQLVQQARVEIENGTFIPWKNSILPKIMQRL